MNFKSILVLILVFITTAVPAGETEINIKGKVIASPCTVNSNTVLKPVEFPKAETWDMREPASGGEWVDFVLELDECPAYLSAATATFSGEPDEADASMYKNLGNATNVALQIVARTTTLSDGSELKVDISLSTHKAFFPLSARMYSPQGNVGEGTFSSVVGVDFTYN